MPTPKPAEATMKVYILDNGDYPEDRQIIGVFDSPVKAVEYQLDHPEKIYKNPGPSIQEWTIQ